SVSPSKPATGANEAANFKLTRYPLTRLGSSGRRRSRRTRPSRCRTGLERGEPQIEGDRLALRQREGRPTLAPCLEHIRIPFLARLQVSHGNRQIPAGRQAPDRESALLIGTRALDEARVRPP